MENIYKNKRKINFGDVKKEVKEKIIEFFGNEWEEIAEGFNFYISSASSINSIVSLPYTEFDMRGDGDTFLMQEQLINLEIIKSQSLYAIGVVLCKKLTEEKAYAIYKIDYSEILILEIH